MKKWILILACLACSSAWAAETTANSNNTATDKTTTKQAMTKKVEPQKEEPKKEAAKKVTQKKTSAKKQPGTMEKAGNNVKSGWNKFTHDVKQGAKKPACTPAQRSMNQCQ